MDLGVNFTHSSPKNFPGALGDLDLHLTARGVGKTLNYFEEVKNIFFRINSIRESTNFINQEHYVTLLINEIERFRVQTSLLVAKIVVQSSG